MLLKKFFCIILILITFSLFFANAKYITESVVKSSIFCSKTLIPSIFPFMVTALFLVNFSSGSNINNASTSTPSKIFGICKIYYSAVIFGSISGFVTGAKCICKIYDNDKTDHASFNHSVAVSSNAGIGFTVSCVGILIWGSPLFGILLYLTQIISALILGRIFYEKCESEYSLTYGRRANYIKAFTDAVTSSAFSLLSICAFVTVFSLVSDIATLYLSQKAAALMNIILEFSGGVFKCSVFSSEITCGFLCGFCVGFGGLSAVFQIISVCSDYPLNKARFVLYKLTHGIVLGIFTMIIVRILDVEPLMSSFSFTDTNIRSDHIFLIVYCITILLIIFSYNYIRHLKRR